jgi:subtilase family serine protease
MLRITIILTLLALVQPSVASATASCGGANPSITGVAVQSVSPQGGPNGLNRYNLVGTVVNMGSEAQASNVLQFVDIYAYGNKLDERGIPPLRPGQSYTFTYPWLRSTGAGNGTTTLNFQIDMRQGQDCNPSNGSYSVRF